MPSTATQEPTIGALVAVRGQRWVVSDVEAGGGSHLVSLQSVEDGRYGETLDVIWEVEPGREVLPSGSLPQVTEHGFDPPHWLAAFLDAVRWSAVTSADVKTLQAPFRSGVAIEDYQLEPVARTVDASRVYLLLADDVGLGKTIEAGLVAQELLLRHRSRRIMIVCPAGLTPKWRDEMSEKFGLDFVVIDTERCATVRRTYGSAANAFGVYPCSIVSLPWLRGQKAQRLLDEVLPPGGPSYPRTLDLLILDEAHHVAPHNGYRASFTALLEILDNQRFARGVEPDKAAVRDTVVRRLKRDIVNHDGTPRFPHREPRAIPVSYPDDEREIHTLLKEFAALRLGFTMEPDRAGELIEKDPRNAEVLFPYVNGQDLNSRPDCSANRWVIDFHDWPEEKAKTYSDCYDQVLRPVKPERDRNNRKVYRDYWWHYAEKRPAMVKAIAGLGRAVVIARVSKTAMPVVVPTGQVMNEKVVVFATDDPAMLALLGSAPHYWWAVTHSVTLKTDLQYAPTDVFETLALPDPTPQMRELGNRLDTFRRDGVMLARQTGLTATYNLVHSPDCQDEDIVELRRIHRAIDEATCHAYGWDDLVAQGLGHGFHPVGRETRYTVGPAIQRESLDRLLEENHKRYAAEVTAGLHTRKKAGRRAAAPADEEGTLFTMDEQDESEVET